MVGLQKVFLFSLMSLLSFGMLAEVIARYIFDFSLFGLEQFIGYAAVWLYFIGAAYGSYERTHIKAEFINIIVSSEAHRNSIRAFAAALSTLMSIIFTKWSWQFCAESIAMGEAESAYGIPMVYFQASLFVGGLLMSMYFFIETLDYTSQVSKRDRG